MPVLRKNKPSGFTIINNTAINDSTLSGKALGYLVRLASKPENWNFSVRGLAAEYSDGRESIQNALNELEDHGYLMRKQIVDNGKFVDTEYIFDDEPMPEAIELAKAKRAKKEEKKAAKSPKKKTSVADFQPPVKNAPKSEPLENSADTHFSPCTGNPYTVGSVVGKPDTEKPDTGKPDTENPYSNIINKDKINNTNNLSYQSDILHSEDENSDKIDRIDDEIVGNEVYETYKEIVKENIEYDYFVSAYEEPNIRNRPNGSLEELNEVVDIMTDTICCSAPTIRVGKESKPTDVVKARFLKLGSEEIRYLFDCLSKNSTKMHNPKAYIITALYNASLTNNISVNADVRYDFTKTVETVI